MANPYNLTDSSLGYFHFCDPKGSWLSCFEFLNLRGGSLVPTSEPPFFMQLPFWDGCGTFRLHVGCDHPDASTTS